MAYTVELSGMPGPRNPRRKAPRRARGPVTKVNAPAAPEDKAYAKWTKTSQDGLWRFDRDDNRDHGSQWTVTYLPTGQTASGYPALVDAREDTAGTALLTEVRHQALSLLLDTDPDRARDGQRLLAIHRRMAGDTQVDLRCRCGGLLTITPAGAVRHVDACDECRDQISTKRCHAADEHQFCAVPAAAECAHADEHGCRLGATPNRGRGCPKRNADDCCGQCCADN